MPDLESLTDELDDFVMSALGETITYTRSGRAARRFKAHVNYEDAAEDLGAGHMIDQQITLTIRKVDLSSPPSSGDRIVLKRAAGKTFRPSGEPSTDASGTHWFFAVKEVR